MSLRALAQETTKTAGSDPLQQIDHLYRCVFQRAPSPRERASCQEFLQKRTLIELARVFLNTNEFIYRD